RRARYRSIHRKFSLRLRLQLRIHVRGGLCACARVGRRDVKALGWLDHVGVGRKIAAIVGTLLIPVAFLTYLLITEKQISISFAQAEVDGVAFLRPVEDLMLGAVRATRGGAAEASWARWEQALDAAQLRYGEAMETAEPLVAVRTAARTLRAAAAGPARDAAL